MPRRPRGSRLGGSRGVPVLVPVRASPVPSVVRGSFFVKFLFWFRNTLPTARSYGLMRSLAFLAYLPWLAQATHGESVVLGSPLASL